jgi:hypothetical protein
VNPTWDHVIDIPPRPTIRGMAGRLGMADITTLPDIRGMEGMAVMAGQGNEDIRMERFHCLHSL